MRARRKIETVIGQLTDRFNIQKVRARDLWHLSHRFIRKILSHTVCVVMNKNVVIRRFNLKSLFKVEIGVALEININPLNRTGFVGESIF